VRIRESTWWVWFLVAGAVGFAFLGIHVVILHLPQIVSGQSYSEALSFKSVVERGRSTFFTATYIVLLAALLYHGLYGLRAILIELFTSRAVGRTISWGLSLLGLATFAYGTYTTILAARLSS
jgi:succinate dehydrogenase hydrophobic anchor subunit